MLFSRFARRQFCTNSPLPYLISEYRNISERILHSCFLDNNIDISLAIAHGSSVVPQLGYNYAKNGKGIGLDLMLIVKDISLFHYYNMKYNRGHYSFIPRYILSPHYIHTNIVESNNSNKRGYLYYNTNINYRYKNKYINYKYCVCSESDIYNDLITWRDLYLPGRLNQPIHIIHNNNNDISNALHINLRNSLATALLLLYSKFLSNNNISFSFTNVELFKTILLLSYTGDIRWKFNAESRNKINNIVLPNIDRFTDIYRVFYKDFHITEKDNNIHVKDLDINYVIEMLPLLLKNGLQLNNNPPSTLTNNNDIHTNLINNRNIHKIYNILNSNIYTTSKILLYKNFITAGPITSMIYSFNKLKKGFKS